MIWVLCVLTVFISSCQEKPQETTYKEVVIQAPEAQSPTVAPAQAPLDQTMPDAQAANMPADPHAGLDMSAMAGMLGANSATSNMFSWDTPQGWQEVSGSGMRLATFHLVSDAKAIDCSIVSLGGMAGGLEANLRRWMGQIGVVATADDLGRLISSAPDTTIKTGQGGKVFDFTAVQAKSQPTDKSMVVVMVPVDEATLFVKMAGTLESVGKNKEGFFKLIASIQYHPSSAEAPAAVAPSPSLDMNTAGDPHAGLDMSAMSGLINAPVSQNILAWNVPSGWKEEPGKHMRMASFHAISGPQAIDCYIIALAGPAGGTEANLNRWMGQLGLDVTDDHLKQLIVTAQGFSTKDGIEGKVFDFTHLQTQGNPSDKSMIAAMLPLDKMTVFVKMNGSIESVKQNKDNFLKLLSSMTRK